VPNSRAAIIQAATHLFATRGYAKASLRDIAAACNLAPTLVYHHFDGKAGLLRSCMQRILEEIGQPIKTAVADGKASDLHVAVADVGEACVSWSFRHPDEFRLLGRLVLFRDGISEVDFGAELGAAIDKPFEPLIDRLVDDYGESARLAFVHARISLFGAIVAALGIGDLMIAPELRDAEIEQRAREGLATAFTEGLFNMLEPR